MGGLGPWARYGLLAVAHLLALGLGAVVLQALEGPPAHQLQAQLRAELATFQENHRACLAPGLLEELLALALAAQAHGVSLLGNSSEAGNWDLPSALLFTSSLLTTAGYGCMAPLSAGGKAFCVVYAALGLPASLALVAALRRGLQPALSRPWAWVAARWQLAPGWMAPLQAAGLGLLVVSIFVLLPALVLWGAQEGYSLLEAVYFCFGSLSTIGLGDLLPARGRGLHPALYHLGQLALLGAAGLWCSPSNNPGEEKKRKQGEMTTRSSGVVVPALSLSDDPAAIKKSYMFLGLLAMLLAVETFSELPQVRALVTYFRPTHPESSEDQGGILDQDELALSAVPAAATAPGQVPAC
ncbi:potassium channel subfamily K member 7 isoform X1 [Erinaceus europaeus]|uniref:Potassium channel subfamily K member 7 isoform X1 n=1 Tax=Erinaceus europaeus TaxID=9365 RepID=A0ABM3W636_ERIEU|nr:potassium channel subfamily K member 7 isoform X1 [Erinaceus europaeus]